MHWNYYAICVPDKNELSRELFYFGTELGSYTGSYV